MSKQPVIPLLFFVTCYLQVNPVLASAWLSSWELLGCYVDHMDVRERSLPYVQYVDKEMTIDKCIHKCNSHGFAYAGLEFATECYCSKHPPRYDKLLDETCSKTCAGSTTDSRPCGGPLSLSVYHTAEITPPTRERPLLCLVMMVKDEAHTIVETLKSVKSIIDCYVILDTGSTDGTQKIMAEFLSPVVGKLYREPFVDYGATRNRVLDLARDTYKPTFTLMLSADEQVVNPKDLRAFLEDHEFSEGPQHDAYPVIMNAGADFDSVRVARVDGKWCYVGRVHEYLTSPQKAWVDLYRFTPEVRVQFKATDETRRFQSQYTIIRILLEDLAVNPQDTRALIYLGRTYSLVGNHTEAYKHWDSLSKYSKSPQEQYHAMMMKAQSAKHIGKEWSFIQDIYFEAYALLPEHMNALHAIAQHYYDSSHYQLSYLYMSRAIQIPRPAILDKSNPNYKTMETYLREGEYLYDYEGDRLLGFAAEHVQQWNVCIESLNRVLKDRPTDTYATKVLRNCQTKAGVKVDVGGNIEAGDLRGYFHSIPAGDVSHDMDALHLDELITHSWVWFILILIMIMILIWYIQHNRTTRKSLHRMV